MKVLHFKASGKIGGAERAVYQLVKSQREFSEFEPVVAFLNPTGYFYEETKKLGCKIINIDLKYDRHIYKAFNISKEINKYPIHHFHSIEMTSMLASLLCKNTIRVFTQRGGACRYNLKQLIRYKLFGVNILKSFHGYSGNTKHACLEGSNLFSIDINKWHLTYNGLDFKTFEPKQSAFNIYKELSISPNSIVIGTASHLRNFKRVELLLRACAKLTEYNFRLLIIGDGPDKKRLEYLSRQLGLNGKSVFTGMKVNIYDYLQILDIFVLPSNKTESFGNSLVEAMSRGIPGIVLKDGGGIVEHIKNGETGYIVETVNDLSTALGELIEKQSFRKKMGSYAKKYVNKYYSLKNMAEQYDELYRNSIKYKNRKL